MIVELIGNAQYRLAELKSPAVIYKRDDNTYVRIASEFHSKFKPHDQENQGGL